jgi:hypothetical protein
VAPYGVEPEEVYGPRSYLDDRFFCAYVAQELQRLVPAEMVEEAWEAVVELGPAVQRTLEVTAAELDARRDAVRRYVGLH